MHSEDQRHYGLDMDALVIACARNRKIIMFWAWMLWLSYAPGTRTLFSFGHECTGNRMHSEHERYCGLGVDALVTLLAWNTSATQATSGEVDQLSMHFCLAFTLRQSQ